MKVIPRTMSGKNFSQVVRMAIGCGLKDEDLLTLLMLILRTDSDCEQMKKWFLSLRSKPTTRQILDKAKEISGNYGDLGE